MPQHCAGALILHKKLGRPNWRIPFAGTLGLLYARTRRAGRELRTRSSILFQVTSTPLTNQRTNGGETSI